MYPVAKRLLDVVGAALLLVVLSPLLGGVALAIWAVDGRPVLFTQRRAGRDGTPFRIYKFRTLEAGPTDPTRPADHTIPLGDRLRRWALDELPQLWNVLRGEMSLVGPRPVPLPHIERYGEHERVRLRVRPGLTGWAQIQGRNALSWPERIEHDIQYVRARGIGFDLYILCRTPGLLLSGVGVTGPEGRNPPPRPTDSTSPPLS
jgi:lipopolysaccharide/colanic/teichoic acid biosynthesis glycosyltransferase